MCECAFMIDGEVVADLTEIEQKGLKKIKLNLEGEGVISVQEVQEKIEEL